jgi:uncharacterized SAM-binding protein YcdF (DUF218 family)
VKTPSLYPGKEPPEMLQYIQGGKWDTKAFQEAIFISIQWLSRFTKGWALRTKGLCKQVTEARSQV